MLKKKRPEKRIYHYLIIAGFVFLALYITVLDNNSFLRVLQAKHRNNTLRKEVQLVEKQNQNLVHRNRAMRNNPQEIEKYAREKMGMQKPTEKVYRFFKEPKAKSDK